MSGILTAKILLRVSPQEKAKLETEARSRGQSVNTYIRTNALRLPSEEQAELVGRIEDLETRVEKLER